MLNNKNSANKTDPTFNATKISVDRKSNNGITTSRFSPIFLLVLLVVVISFLTRVALLLKTGKSFDYSITNITGSFAIGLFFDLAMSAYLIVPFVFQIWFTNEKMYSQRWKWVAVAA